MSLLRFDVLEWISRVRERPVLASDPDELRTLAERARHDWGGGFVAQHQPVAPYTWEQTVVLRSAAASSDRVQFRLPFGVEIVGMWPSLEPLGTGAAPLPTLAAISVAIDSNVTEQYTLNNGTSAAGVRGGTFVTLEAISSAHRLFGLRLDTPNPELGFTFQWKRGPNVYQDVQIGVTLFTRRLPPGAMR